MIDPSIITSAATGFAASYIAKGDSGPLQTLDDLWSLAFGRIHQIANLNKAKREAQNEINITQYKNSIAEEILKIPEENLQEPQMSIVGPALEASKYYIEEEELRNMFAKVIAASMDSSKSEKVHHSFVEIIKQLSPRDAKNINFIKVNPIHPIVNFALKTKGAPGSRLIKPLIFSSDLESGSFIEQDAPSIYNLERLCLLSFSFEEHLTKEDAYQIYENSIYFQTFKSHFENDNQTLELTKGILRLNPLGIMFTEVCM